MNPLYKKFRAVCRRQKFVEPNDSVLVGVSGGLDSMVLAHLLVQLKKDINFQLSVAHVNYCLRGKESDAQEALVKDFAKKHHLICFATRAEISKKSKENFQAQAREFRYHYFTETALARGVGKIAVAHHLEDQVETILAQWLRGASLRGLGGMRVKREVRSSKYEVRNTKHIELIRPMLSFSKEQLLAFAQEEGVPFIEDSSNASPKYWRNRIRHELLPVIRDLRPKAFEKIRQFGEEMSELSAFVESLAQDWLKEFSKKEEHSLWIPKPRWASLPKPLRLEIFHQAYVQLTGDSKNLKRDHLVRCEQLSLGLKTNGHYNLPQDIRFVRSGDDLTFFKDSLGNNNAGPC